MLPAADTHLICGGIYGNWQALTALLQVAKAQNIPSANIIITGDLIAYCADGARVAAHIQQHLPDATIIRGNCERAIAENSDDCGCGFDPGSTCSTLSIAWYRHARATIPAAIRQWFATLPPTATKQIGSHRIAIIHGGADADNTFIFPSTPAQEKQQHLNTLKTSHKTTHIIAGHSGIPFTQHIDGQIWHNSGAIGMPANDGTPRTWYSTWRSTPEGSIEITHHPLSYNHQQTAAAMQTAGLPPDYRSTLSTGIWPSDSILPQTEKQQQGTPLNPPPTKV